MKYNTFSLSELQQEAAALYRLLEMKRNNGLEISDTAIMDKLDDVENEIVKRLEEKSVNESSTLLCG